MMRKLQQSRIGFTLVELLISLAIGATVLAGVLTGYMVCRKLVNRQRLQNEIRANVRTLMMYLVKDLSMTGYGLPVSDAELSSWTTLLGVTGMTNNPQIIQGSAGYPDRIRIAAAFRSASTLAADAAAGSTTIVLSSNNTDAAWQNQLWQNDNKLIYVGGCELARLTGDPMGGTTLTISTHPSNVSGLTYNHQAGEPVEMIQVYDYSYYGNLTDGFYISRGINDSTDGYWWYTAIAYSIFDIVFSRSDQMMTVTITGRSEEADLIAAGGSYSNGYQWLTMMDNVIMRNL